MPTYAYRCADCGHAFDVVQAFTDDSLTECPVCGGRLRKQFAAVGVTFNGSGFYRTDSRANVSGNSEKSSGGSSEKSSGGSSSDSSSGSTTPSSPAPAATPAKSKPAGSSGSGGGTTS